MTDKRRECFLDILRIIACFLVIVNHTNSDIFLNTAAGSLTWFASLTYFFVSKIAVPIFFMISGYLLLGKIDSTKKMLQRIGRILVALIGCGVVYAIFDTYYMKSDPSVLTAIKDFLFIYFDSPSNALWYLYAYLGILLMLPFLQKMTSVMTKRDYHVFFVISVLYYSVLPVLNHYVNLITISSEIKLPLFDGTILFLFIGQYFARFGIKKTRRGFCISAALYLLTLAFNVVATYYEHIRFGYNYLFFDNRIYFPILLQSVCVFYMISFVKLGEKTERVISYVGACTFGIFLLSDMNIGFLKFIFTGLSANIHPLFAVVIYEICVFVIGGVVVSLLRMVPLVKKVL
ncbi:MAG: hypothetical protein E7619_10555 [Ruminococcaceae bacterium]|nr:hypothetical protein [Oscillospiraceae bacterium]